MIDGCGYDIDEDINLQYGGVVRLLGVKEGKCVEGEICVQFGAS